MRHTLIFDYFKSGTGFRSRCSCGKRFGSATGCNRSGSDYARAAVWDVYKKHCRKLNATPSMHEDVKGLAGCGV